MKKEQNPNGLIWQEPIGAISSNLPLH